MKYYNKEQEEFREFYALKLTEEQAHKIHKKLCKHFDLPKHSHLVFKKLRGGGGRYFSTTQLIIIDPNSLSLGIVIHELGHALEFKANGRYRDKIIPEHRVDWYVEKNRTKNKPIRIWKDNQGIWRRRVKRKAHTKKLTRCIKKIVKYVARRQYWGMLEMTNPLCGGK